MISNDVCRAVPVPKVPALFPGRPSVATVWRWILKGVRGPNGEKLRLESFKCGGRRFVSCEAIERFIAAGQATPNPAVVRAESAHRAEAASKALEKLGA